MAVTYIVAEPANTMSKRLYGAYWRITFLTRRVVRFKDCKAKGKLDGVLVFSTNLKIKPCVQHMLFKKNYPVKDKRCKNDYCLTCYPESARPLRVTGW